MNRKMSIVCTIMLGLSGLFSGGLMAMELHRRERAKAFLVGMQPIAGAKSPVQTLTLELSKRIIELAQPERFDITLQNNLQSSFYIRIREVTGAANPHNWPILLQGSMGYLSGICSPPVSAQITLPVAPLRMGIAIGLNPHQRIFYIQLNENDVRELKNSDPEMLVIKELSNTRYVLAGWSMRGEYSKFPLLGSKIYSTVWMKQGIPQVVTP